MKRLIILALMLIVATSCSHDGHKKIDKRKKTTTTTTHTTDTTTTTPPPPIIYSTSNDNSIVLCDSVGVEFKQTEFNNKWHIEFTSPLENIIAYTFSDNPRLTEIIIPETVKTIQKGAFKNCPNLHNVVCNAIEPPKAVYDIAEQWEAFDGNHADRKIYVPQQSLEKYKSANGWKEYTDCIEPIR